MKFDRQEAAKQARKTLVFNISLRLCAIFNEEGIAEKELEEIYSTVSNILKLKR